MSTWLLYNKFTPFKKLVILRFNMKNIVKITFGCTLFLSQAFVTNPIDAVRTKKFSPKKNISSSNKENKTSGTGINGTQPKINQFFKTKNNQIAQKLPFVIDLTDTDDYLVESNEITFSTDVNIRISHNSITSEESNSSYPSLSESDNASTDDNSEDIEMSDSNALILDIIPGEIKIDLTENDYINTLKNVIHNSQKSLIIASNLLSLHKKFKGDLYTLLWRAKHLRNVDISIFFSDISEDSKEFLEFLNTHQITYAVAKTPANFIISDDSFIALGSTDWLSDVNLSIKCPSSISIEGEASKDLINIVKNSLSNALNINSNVAQDNKLSVFKIDNENEVFYLNAQNNHHEFLEIIFETSKKVIIFCPTIWDGSNCKAHKITKNLISKALNANKDLKITFIFDPFNPSFNDIQNDIDALNYFHPHRCQALEASGYFTKNTLIADNSTIIEGSFGWTLKDAEGFSIAINGPKASAEIDRFVKMYLLASM